MYYCQISHCILVDDVVFDWFPTLLQFLMCVFFNSQLESRGVLRVLKGVIEAH